MESLKTRRIGGGSKRRIGGGVGQLGSLEK